MSVVQGQPSIRFNAAGPFALQGVSYEPKYIFLRKAITTTENEDFISVPAGTYINEAIAVVTNACDANTEVSLGTDGSAEAIFSTTAFSVETLGNSCHFTTGLYLKDGDTLRLAIGGTPAAGEVEVLISYFELGDMASNGFHFDL